MQHRKCRIKGLDEECLYLVHHPHHYLSKKDAIHELHHCFLYSQPNMKGKRYKIKHLYVDVSLFHGVSPDCSEKILYDHRNNKFKLASVADTKGKKHLYIKEKI